MTSRGRPNLIFKGLPWEVDLACAQDVLRMSPQEPSEYSNLHVPKYLQHFKTFPSELIRFSKST